MPFRFRVATTEYMSAASFAPVSESEPNDKRRPITGPRSSRSTSKCRYRHFLVENAIRPLALNRKNALFAGHDEGGAAWARIASLVETAKMNRVNPHAYLKATLEAIANGHPASEIDQLLPWAFTPISS